MLNEEDILENIKIEDKVQAQKNITHRIAIRKFLEESCELAKILPPHKRILFVMHFSEGFSVSQIADLCKVTPSVVTKRIRQIADELNQMRKCLKVIDNGKTNKSTKERIATYFRREAKRRRSIRKSKNIDKSI